MPGALRVLLTRVARQCLAGVRQHVGWWLPMASALRNGRKRFVFRPVTFHGHGLTEEFVTADWATVRGVVSREFRQ